MNMKLYSNPSACQYPEICMEVSRGILEIHTDILVKSLIPEDFDLGLHRGS